MSIRLCFLAFLLLFCHTSQKTVHSWIIQNKMWLHFIFVICEWTFAPITLFDKCFIVTFAFSCQQPLSSILGMNWYCSTFKLGNTFCTQSWDFFWASQQFGLLFQELKYFFNFGYKKCSPRLIHEFGISMRWEASLLSASLLSLLV